MPFLHLFSDQITDVTNHRKKWYVVKMKQFTSKSVVLFLAASVFNFYLVSGKSVCSEEELNEAQRAFRNCVESAKAGIVSAHANEENQDLVCDSLENMLSGCESQVNNFHKKMFL